MNRNALASCIAFVALLVSAPLDAGAQIRTAVPLRGAVSDAPLKAAPATLTLAAPTGVTVRNDPASLAFSWQPVAGATGYQIDVAPQPAGPWTSLTPQPVATTQFVHLSPTADALAYYRFAAVRTLGASGSSSITVPWYFHRPTAPLGVSAVQRGADVVVSWVPVAGANGYAVEASGFFPPSVTLRAKAAMGSVTFAGLIDQTATQLLAANQLSGARFSVSPMNLLPPGWPALGTSLTLGPPAICWPNSAPTPGGQATTITVPLVGSVGLTLSWPRSFLTQEFGAPTGAALAYRVERMAAGTAAWVQVGCLTANPNATTFAFQDQSIALRPSTSYQYRVTAIYASNTVGDWQLGADGYWHLPPPGQTIESSATAMVVTAPPENPKVGVSLATREPGVPARLVLAWPPLSSLVKAYMITSSYGYLGSSAGVNLGGHVVNTVPSGTHSFTVTALYANGAPAGSTTVTAVVP